MRRAILALVLAIGTAAGAVVAVAADHPTFKPRQKSCVGDPPRQLEDPLSPACIPFWDGRGGRSWPGVDRRTVRMVLYNDLGIVGDLTQPWRPSDETNVDEPGLVRTVKAHLRYFQRRMQTYGRTVRLVGQPRSGRSCAQMRADAQRALLEVRPFGAIVLAEDAGCYVEQFAERERVSFVHDLEPGALFADADPHVWSLLPDHGVLAASMAGFLCRSLAGGTPRFAGDPALHGQARSFAIAAPDHDPEPRSRGPATYAARLAAATMDTCGVELPIYRYSYGPDGALVAAASALSQASVDGVTSLICLCEGGRTARDFMIAAAAIGYRPEWIWDPVTGMDDERALGDAHLVGGSSFGVTWRWRQGALRDSHHARAYLAEEPGTVPNEMISFDSYHAMLLAFTAIQTAGVELTPTAIRAGLDAGMAFEDLGLPWVPSGGFDAAAPPHRGPSTFIDSAAAWWWDPAGTPPGGRAGDACIRMSMDGRRARGGTWPVGDDWVMDAADPCTGPIRGGGTGPL